jgi:hypothetical protein
MTASLPHGAPADQAEPQTPLVRAHPGLIALVVGLGIAILIVLGLMVGFAINRASNPTTNQAAKPLPASVPQAQAALDAPAYNTFTLREGATVAETRLVNDQLMIRTTGDDADEILIFNARTGELQTRLTLKRP